MQTCQVILTHRSCDDLLQKAQAQPNQPEVQSKFIDWLPLQRRVWVRMPIEQAQCICVCLCMVVR